MHGLMNVKLKVRASLSMHRAHRLLPPLLLLLLLLLPPPPLLIQDGSPQYKTWSYVDIPLCRQLVVVDSYRRRDLFIVETSILYTIMLHVSAIMAITALQRY